MTLYSTIIRVYCRVQLKKKIKKNRVGACRNQHHVSWNVVLTRADWSTSPGNSLSHFENGWGRLMIRCFSKSKNNFRRLRDVFGLGRPLSEDGTDVWRTSSGESRRPLDVTCGAAILIPRWRRRKWRQPRLGGEFFDPHWGGGGKWRPFHFRPPYWMTSFPVLEVSSSKMVARSGRASIFHLHLNGGRKTFPILLGSYSQWQSESKPY